MKEKIYKRYERSNMLNGSKTWCLNGNEVAVLRRAEKSIMKVMCDVKLVDKKNTEKLMDMLGLKEAEDNLAMVNGMRWYRHVLR